MKCPTCGSEVTQSTGDEGTGCFIPLPAMPPKLLDEVAEAMEDFLALRKAHGYITAASKLIKSDIEIIDKLIKSLKELT